jgi:hypothetical protein
MLSAISAILVSHKPRSAIAALAAASMSRRRLSVKDGLGLTATILAQ